MSSRTNTQNNAPILNEIIIAARMAKLSGFGPDAMSIGFFGVSMAASIAWILPPRSCSLLPVPYSLSVTPRSLLADLQHYAEPRLAAHHLLIRLFGLFQ